MKVGKLAWLRLGEFFRAFERKHVIRLLLIVGAIVGIFWFAISAVGRPIGSPKNVRGTVETAFSAGQRTPGYTAVTVMLDNGTKVSVDLPYGIPFVRDARVELAVTSHNTGFGVQYRYKFARYLENESEPTQ